MDSTVVKEGWMTKQGQKFKTWRRRWFQITLSDKKLSYYKQPNSEIKGALDLSDLKLVELAPESKKQPAFKICPKSKNRIYYFVTDTPEEARSWVQVINGVASGHVFTGSLRQSDFQIQKTICLRSRCEIQLASLQQHSGSVVLKTYKRSTLSEVHQTNLRAVLEQKKRFLHLVSPFVTSLHTVIEDTNEIILVYEHIPSGCLFGHLWETEIKFSEKVARFFAVEIILALDFLHTYDVVYGKLCPDSILICQDGHIKLTDPGLTQGYMLKDDIPTPYDPPEQLGRTTLTVAQDWYSLGALIYEMICGMPPFWYQDIKFFKLAILRDNVRFPHHVSNQAKNLILRLMDKNPLIRLGMGPNKVDEIKQHAFFNGIDWAQAAAHALRPEWTKPDKTYVVLPEY